MRIFKKYIKTFRILFVVTLLVLALETLADLYQPMLLSRLVDEGIATLDLMIVKHFGLLMLGVTGFGLICALTRNFLSTHIAYSFAKALRDDLFKKVLSLSTTQAENIGSGSLVTRLTNDVAIVQMFVMGIMRIFLRVPMLALGSLLMVFNLDHGFLVVYSVLVPVIVLLTILNIKLGFPLYSKIQRVVDRLNQKTMEFLGGIRAVRAFNRFEYEMIEFHEISDALKDMTIRTMRIMALFRPLIMISINLTIVYVFYAAKIWVVEGRIGVGQLMAFSNYMVQFFFAMNMISNVFNIFVRAKASLDRIGEILEAEDEHAQVLQEDVENPEMVKDYSICFKDVSFRYGSGIPTLNHLNFTINSGEKIGLIGATGSGKTTLIHLINRLIHPTHGEILVGQVALGNLSKKTLCDLVGYVPQKTLLFTGSVLYNLSWGKRGLDKGLYEKALKEASALDFVETMPDYMDSLLGKNGINLSGGQKQRLSIARALVHQPKILLLDDTTSAVDVITEKSIKSQLRNYENMTMILIAQKVSSVKDLDRIMLIENGQLLAFDTHENLLMTSVMYQALYEAEFGKEYTDVTANA